MWQSVSTAGCRQVESFALDCWEVRIGRPHLDLPLVDVDEPVGGNALFLVEPAFGEAVSPNARGRQHFNHQVERPDVAPLTRSLGSRTVSDEEVGLDESILSKRNIRWRCQQFLDPVGGEIVAKPAEQALDDPLMEVRRRRRTS